MTVHQSACPLDCPDICSLEVSVEDGRVTSIDGTNLNPYTNGFICGKVRRFGQHMYGADRILRPAVRDGAKGEGRFRDVSWDEALDLITTRLREARDTHGGESILPYSYGGCNGYLTQDTTDARLFRRLGASRLGRTLCAQPTSAAAGGLYGRMSGVALEDYVHAELIVVWGTNPSATGIHFIPVVKEAQSRGAKLIVVDPLRTPLAKRADLHIAPRPGTDLPLALSIIDRLFTNGGADETFLAEHTTGAEELRRRASEWPTYRAAKVAEVSAADIEVFADEYAKSRPAVIRCGWGQERNRNGGGASAAIYALPAIAGKFGVRGGGFTASNGRAFGIDTSAAICEPEPDTRKINMTQIGRVLCEERHPPVKVLFVYNCNPAVSAPDQRRVLEGLAREDLFTIAFDQVITDTAAYADVILPATTFFEHRELRSGYGSMRMFDALAVVEPVGESRPNYDVFAELLDRLELSRDGEPRTAEELALAIVESAPNADELRQRLAAGGPGAPAHGVAPIQMVDVLPQTPSGKIELVPEALDREAPGGLYFYRPDPGTNAQPIALISPALAKTISSSFAQLIDGLVPVRVAAVDAAARGIESGDEVRVWNALAEVLCSAVIDPDVRPGVAVLPKGLWRKHTRNGLTASALAPDALSDLGGGATFNDARVDIERV